ncbi:Aldehyde/histidinol dehydrogenase [Ganoderma leucocontextum]|nr:Aldehyde/histidinol dehydrogenase [Ganoderma leucocontextum]
MRWKFPLRMMAWKIGPAIATGCTMISEHPTIEKVAFTASTLMGRKIMESAAKSNLKNVTLELGGKSPTIVFDDAAIDQAIKWAACMLLRGLAYLRTGDKRFTEHTKMLKVGDPFSPERFEGP